MGVEGVATATIISQIVSCLLVYIKLTKTDDVHKLVVRDLKIDGRILTEVINIGIPAALQSCLISFSNVFIQRYINMFGSDAIAGIGAAQKVDAFSNMPSQSISLAITTFVSQNLGAGKTDRVHKSMFAGNLITFISIMAIAIPCFIFAPQLVRLFNNEESVVYYGVSMCRAILLIYWILSFSSVYAGVNRGYGYSKEVMAMSLSFLVVTRQIYLYTFMKLTGSIYVVYFGYPVAWGMNAIANYVFYLRKIKIPEKKGYLRY